MSKVDQLLDDLALRDLVSRWSFPGWEFEMLASGHLPRNRGVPVLEFKSSGHNSLLDSQPQTPGALTSFRLETPFCAPLTSDEARIKGLNLVRFVMMHEVGEFFKEEAESLFDPHALDNEDALYQEIPVLWRTGE